MTETTMTKPTINLNDLDDALDGFLERDRQDEAILQAIRAKAIAGDTMAMVAFVLTQIHETLAALDTDEISSELREIDKSLVAVNLYLKKITDRGPP
jgi:hypothetical protein